MFYPSFIQHTHSFLTEGENNEDYSKELQVKKQKKKNVLKYWRQLEASSRKLPKISFTLKNQLMLK